MHSLQPAGHLGHLWASLSGSLKAPWEHLRLEFPAPLLLMLSPPQFPSKNRLVTVAEFFAYSEREGRTFFDSLDADSKGYVTEKELRRALSARNLPPTYATTLITKARGSRWWLHHMTWDQFKTVLDERDPDILQAFTSLELSTEGSLQPAGLKESLRKMGLPATDAVAAAMLRAIGSEEDGAVSYGRFRNFMVLLPPDKTPQDLPLDWYEAATMVPFGPPSPPPPSPPSGALRNILMATLAGGMASASTTLVLHPIDTLKARLQCSPGATLKDVPRWFGAIGARGLYRGMLPALTGAFLGHGLRTGGYETALRALEAMGGHAMGLQAQGLASGVGTLVGTATRIPCEVLKQRLQIGLHPSAPAALQAALAAEGVPGLFRGTGATLMREVPFYMLGMVLYQQLKRLANGSAFGHYPPRELSRREIVAMGTLAGCMSAFATCPADVVKTRVMTAAAGSKVTAVGVLVHIFQKEGVRALFRGAVARMLWTAPVGAINFAGYELAKQALITPPPEAHPPASEDHTLTDHTPYATIEDAAQPLLV